MPPPRPPKRKRFAEGSFQDLPATKKPQATSRTPPPPDVDEPRKAGSFGFAVGMFFLAPSHPVP